MEHSEFTHLILWHNKIAVLSFFSLGMSFVSLWMKKTAWLWATFLLFALVLGFEASIISPIALLPILILFFCHYCFTKDINKPFRFILFGIVVIVSLALSFHFLPGFDNWKLCSNTHISPNAIPYTFYLNFDKPWIGIFVLALGLPLITSSAQLIRMLKITLPATILGITIITLVALKIHMIDWDPKVPVIFFPWMIANLLFVSIPEEALFRGFIQKELYLCFGKTPLAACGSVLVTSLFFVLLHLVWVGSFPFLCLVFITSLIYGTLYQITQTIESSIICHYAFNVTHFLLFTYPALQQTT